MKFILTAIEWFFGLKDIFSREIQRREDISVGVDKKTISDQRETINEIKTAVDAGRIVNASDSLRDDPANRDKWCRLHGFRTYDLFSEEWYRWDSNGNSPIQR